MKVALFWAYNSVKKLYVLCLAETNVDFNNSSGNENLEIPG